VNPTLSYLLGHKMWLVPSVNVWGSVASFNAEIVFTENGASGTRIVFGSFPVGGAVQQLQFGDLKDVRGNSLPSELTNPKVAVLQKNDVAVVVSGTETSKSFALAKATPTDRNGICDLLIIELG
jgi:hypothetical protein